MSDRTFSNFKEAADAIRSDMRARERRLATAVRKTARQSANYVARTVPRAFGELADSVHVEDGQPGNSRVVVDAPHAVPVEVGSRPHVVPLEDLIAWVKLRGLQGLTRTGNVRGGRAFVGNSRHEAARGIAQELRGSLGRQGAAAWHAMASKGPLASRELGEDPATVDIAKRIQSAIAKRGTKPHRYMLRAVPPTVQFLADFVKDALPDKE